MAQRVNRNGKRYTVGSSTTYAGWEKKVCCWCKKKLTHKTGATYHYNPGGEPWSTCTSSECIKRGAPIDE